MLDSLWQVLVSVTLVFIPLEQFRLRCEVEKCLRILYEAAEADPEGGAAE